MNEQRGKPRGGKDSTLRRAFLDDHRNFSRHLRQLLDAVRDNDMRRARTLADELDCLAGPHIEFEERVLYPQVVQAEGEQFGRELYGEHRAAVGAIKQVLACDENRPLPPAVRTEVLEGLELAMKHVESCGTLISHLNTLTPNQQLVCLRRLEQFRRNGRRWSELNPKA